MSRLQVVIYFGAPINVTLYLVFDLLLVKILNLSMLLIKCLFL